MQNTQPLRKLLGLTQEQLAGLLGIKRVELAQAERGIRFLPPKAYTRLSLIEYSTTKTNEITTTISKPQLETQLLYCKQKLKQYEGILHKMKEQEQQNLQCLHALKILELQQPNDAHKEKVSLWIFSIQTQVQEAAKHCDKTVQ